MMKNLKLKLALIICIALIQSCTKKETIIQEYKPPVVDIYGTWFLQNQNVTDLSKTYMILNASDDFSYNLNEDKDGFRSSYDYAFSATNKQLNLGGSLYNYTKNGDTLILRQSNNSIQKYIKVANPTMTYENWTSKISIAKRVAAPIGNISSSHSFGFNNDNLYFYSDKYASRVYKYNTLNNTFTDSLNVAFSCSNFYRPGFTYFGFSGNFGLGKTTELQTGTYNQISANTFSSTYAISYNGTSNTFYCYLSNSDLYAGAEGGTFSLVKNLDEYNVNSVVYYGSDEFLVLRYGGMYKIKISPNFTVTKSYNGIPNFNIYTISTDGADVWAYGYNYNTGKYEYLKLNLN